MIERQENLGPWALIMEDPTATRVLLRPHGRSGGRVSRGRWYGIEESITWQVGPSSRSQYSTRAQAAQAVWEEGQKRNLEVDAWLDEDDSDEALWMGDDK